MSSALYSLGRWAARSRKQVFAGWFVLLVLLGGVVAIFSEGLDDGVSIPGTESQEALDTLAATFPQVSGASAQIIVVAPADETVHSPQMEAPIEAAVERVSQIAGVAQVASPFDEMLGEGAISESETAAIINVQMDTSFTEVSDSAKDALDAAVTELAQVLPTGAQASLGGELFSNELPTLSFSELLGVIVAMIVLVVTLGSFIAAGMPLLNAFIGVGVSTLLIFAATAFGQINSTTPMLSLMLGLAVGIDYALFIVARHQDQLRDGVEIGESIGRATATAGSAVVFAGITVMIALLGLGVAGIPFLTTMGVAAAVAVGIAVLVSLTLLPALLGAAGARLTPRNKKQELKKSRSAGFFRAWVRAATRRPVLTIVVVLGVVGLAAVPALHLRLALPDASALDSEDPARITYELVDEHFGPGFNGPLIVTGSLITSNDPVGLIESVADEIKNLDGVADVPLATPNETADTGIIQVVPAGAPDSQETKALVNDLRDLAPHVAEKYDFKLAVTGFTAVGIDVSDKLGAALLPFALVVVGLSLVLLTMVFRSIAVPIKATLGYLLSVGAAFGVVALVFEDGFMQAVLNVARLGPVISFMPIVVMGILFGLAMDYQVFLVSRIREDYVHTGDARASIETGFVATAKVVTAAAVIMVAVFLAFVPEGDSNIKPIALGLAVGVFVDAFLVRMTLVPAALQLLGDKAWWVPRWLDRIMPIFDIEGEGITRELDLRDWPGPDAATDLVVAEGLTLADPDAPDRFIYHDVALRIRGTENTVITGRNPEEVSALLLTLAGRLSPNSGRLKTCGYVLPTRSRAVRSRVGYLYLPTTEVSDLRALLAESPQLLILDGADHLDETELTRVQHTLSANPHVSPLLIGTVNGRAKHIVPIDARVSDVVLNLEQPILQGSF
ncbi:MAG TPA: MMPL family transporter [Actinomycetales bacterium]|nr:MMPL family transporter [Actinomycetales bacterium]